jgi:ABC-type transporter Mla subunit MlaD
MQGITGLLYVDLQQTPGGDANAPPPMGDRYPAIAATSTELDALLANLPDLMAKISTMITHIDNVFSQHNVDAVSQTLANLRATTQGLPKTAAKIAELIEPLHATLDEVAATAASIRGVAEDAGPQVRDTLARLKAAADNLANVTRNVDKFVADAQVQVGHLSEQGLFEFERLLRDARVAANEFRELSRSLKQQPSQLLYEKPNSGTEISR